MQAQFLGREDPLEEEMATHSRILARKIQWTEEAGRLQSVGSPRDGHDLVTNIGSHGAESGFNQPVSLATKRLRLCKTLIPKGGGGPRDAGSIPGSETQVQSLEEEMATHSRILAWKIP